MKSLITLIISLTLTLAFTFIVPQNVAIAESCGGGSCKLYRLSGELKCESCCPVGKSPSCVDVGGCSCTLDSQPVKEIEGLG